MNRMFIVTLCALLLSLCAGCGQDSAQAPGASSAALFSASPSAEDPAQEYAGTFSQSDSASTALENLNPAINATVVQSQDCYDAAFCFRPEQDGTYHFCAQTADSFQGSQVGYDQDTVTWTIYVLDAPFEDSWRQLEQTTHSAASDLNGSTDLSLREGQYVYCVCSLNAMTSDPAPDGAGALSITPTETDYLPSSSNNYQLAITLDSERQIDLDGDGTAESIYYSVTPNQPDANGVFTGAKPESLTINGVEFLSPGQENPTADYGFWLENPDTEYYYIVDLDVHDSYLELAIADQGSNGNTITHYFRYTDGQLSYLGQISGLPDAHTTTFHGDGTVSALTRLDVMQNWSGLRTYALSEGQLTAAEDEFCTPQLKEDRNITLLRPLTVYTLPDQSSAQLILQPSSFSLSFPLTDGTHWVQIRCADGSSGWAYFSAYDTVVSGETTLNASEVFGNLLIAG